MIINDRIRHILRMVQQRRVSFILQHSNYHGSTPLLLNNRHDLIKEVTNDFSGQASALISKMKIEESLTQGKKKATVCIAWIKQSVVFIFYFAAIICTTATIWTSICKYLSYPSRNVVRETETVSETDIKQRMKNKLLQM